ncbi:methyltransferase-like protein 27 isoform X1 [Marmota marmota marmota]|uniref:methyltransferase-like protein 27 isoform X1 n=1 Tax=Marmota marmota marmota TaxID=9994 RepID=UPI0020922C4E|nr:methyltransferase-like protein 27 isoform X1 [Marmota marmota marmota]
MTVSLYQGPPQPETATRGCLEIVPLKYHCGLSTEGPQPAKEPEKLSPREDVAALQYRAPRLAVDCLTQALPGPPHAALILDVACGTGLVAAELQARGFLQLHGVDGSPEMLKQAQACGLYQHLSLCTLGQEPLPSPEGGLVCLTTRANPSNLQYKEALEATLDKLEQAGAWKRLVAQTVDHWELATSPLEVAPGAKDGFISGIIYLYQKQRSP